MSLRARNDTNLHSIKRVRQQRREFGRIARCSENVGKEASRWPLATGLHDTDASHGHGGAPLDAVRCAHRHARDRSVQHLLLLFLFDMLGKTAPGDSAPTPFGRARAHTQHGCTGGGECAARGDCAPLGHKPLALLFTQCRKHAASTGDPRNRSGVGTQQSAQQRAGKLRCGYRVSSAALFALCVITSTRGAPWASSAAVCSVTGERMLPQRGSAPLLVVSPSTQHALLAKMRALEKQAACWLGHGPVQGQRGPDWPDWRCLADAPSS